jgi:hypothetical protein
MNAQTARMEAGCVHLPRKAHWLDEFFHEILAFPVSRHTDQIDALSQALNYAFNQPRHEMPLGLGGKYFVGGVQVGGFDPFEKRVRLHNEDTM